MAAKPCRSVSFVNSIGSVDETESYYFRGDEEAVLGYGFNDEASNTDERSFSNPRRDNRNSAMLKDRVWGATTNGSLKILSNSSQSIFDVEERYSNPTPVWPLRLSTIPNKLNTSPSVVSPSELSLSASSSSVLLSSSSQTSATEIRKGSTPMSIRLEEKLEILLDLKTKNVIDAAEYDNSRKKLLDYSCQH